MLYVSENKDGSQVINLTRGDDAVIDVPLKNLNGDQYPMGQEDYLTFGVREFPNEESELLISIESAPGSNRIVFNHEDTVLLEPGVYSAEIQLTTAEGKRITVFPMLSGKLRTNDRVNRKNFVIMPEVVL